MKFKFTLLSIIALIATSLALTNDLERDDIKMATGWLNYAEGSVSYHFVTEDDSLFHLNGVSKVVSSIMPEFDIGRVNDLGNGYFATSKGLFIYEYGGWTEVPAFSGREVIQILHRSHDADLFVTTNTLEQLIDNTVTDTLYELTGLAEDEVNHRISSVSSQLWDQEYLISVITTMNSGDITKDLYYLFSNETYDSTDLLWSTHTTENDTTGLYAIFPGESDDILLFDSTRAIVLDRSDPELIHKDTVFMNSPVTHCSAAPVVYHAASRALVKRRYVAVSNRNGSFVLEPSYGVSLEDQLREIVEREKGKDVYGEAFLNRGGRSRLMIASVIDYDKPAGGIQQNGLNFMILSTTEGLFHYYDEKSLSVTEHKSNTSGKAITLNKNNHLKLPDSVKSGDIQVMDYRGRLLLNESFSNVGGFSLSLESRGWAKGNYFIKVNCEDGVYNSKINIK